MVEGYVGVNTFLYTPIEYIESSGTQYINTGITGNNNIKIEIEVSNMPPSGSTYKGLYGCRTQYNSSDRFHFQLNSDNKYVFDYGSTTYNMPTGVDLTDKNLIVQNKNVTTVGDKTATATSVTFSCPYAIYLFAINNSNSVNDICSYKLYSCKIYNNDILVRDFIPVLDTANIACLYEKVESKFYYNKGTGAFSAGNATGSPVVIGDKARRILHAYIGVSGVARKIKKGYVGVQGYARLCYNRAYPNYIRTITGDSNQNTKPMVTSTESYVIIVGGRASSNPVTTANAYNANGIATNATALPTRAWNGTTVSFNGYGIVAGGVTGTSGSDRTNQCIAYTNNLTNQALSGLFDYVYTPSAAATSEHFMVGGGSNYSVIHTGICAYNTSFVKSTPTSMSIKRSMQHFAPIDQYIVCCGGHDTYGNVDVYNNSNVKSTLSNPYGNKATDHPLSLGTTNYAITFGGSTTYQVTNRYADSKAYNKNLVLTSFSMPIAASQAQGYSTGEYACVYFDTTELIYDENLVLVSNTNDRDYGHAEGSLAAAANEFAMLRKNGTDSIFVFDI